MTIFFCCPKPEEYPSESNSEESLVSGNFGAGENLTESYHNYLREVGHTSFEDLLFFRAEKVSVETEVREVSTTTTNIPVGVRRQDLPKVTRVLTKRGKKTL